MANNKFKTTSLDQMLDKHLGRAGTYKRDKFESELRLDLLGQAIKQASKIENSAKSARLETIMKVFDAMGAKVNFNVEINKKRLVL